LKTKIKELRKQHKLSQSELADAVGTTRQTITSIEVGKYTASLVLAYKIAHYFNLTIEEVFDFSEIESEEKEMDKKIEKMKQDIQKRIKQNIGLLVCSAIFLVVAASPVIPVQLENENASDYVSGFQLGLLIVLVIYFLNNVVKYNKALKNEKLLKQIYYKEHDERMNYINQKVGESSMWITTVIMTIATVITGYFNFTVFCTMIAVTLLQCIIQILLKWHYTRRTSGNQLED